MAKVVLTVTSTKKTVNTDNSEIEETELKLDEADIQAESTETRLSHKEVFSSIRNKVNK